MICEGDLKFTVHWRNGSAVTPLICVQELYSHQEELDALMSRKEAFEAVSGHTHVHTHNTVRPFFLIIKIDTQYTPVNS